MGAREKLRNCFPGLPGGTSNDLIEAAVDEILGDHAEELAARLRWRMSEMADMYSVAEINQLCRVITGKPAPGAEGGGEDTDRGPGPLAGPGEACRLLGVTIQRLHTLRKQAAFPAPYQVLADGPVWLTSDLTRYQATRRRTAGRPRKEE
jgi:hypothetical protein